MDPLSLTELEVYADVCEIEDTFFDLVDVDAFDAFVLDGRGEGDSVDWAYDDDRIGMGKGYGWRDGDGTSTAYVSIVCSSDGIGAGYDHGNPDEGNGYG